MAMLEKGLISELTSYFAYARSSGIKKAKGT